MDTEGESFVKTLVSEIDRCFSPYLRSDSQQLKATIITWKETHQKDFFPQEAQWELLALDVWAVDREQRQEDPNSRFRAAWTMRNDKANPPALMIYPDVDSLLNDEGAMKYYKARALESPNPIRKARYADLAWVGMRGQGGKEFYQQGIFTARAYLEEATFIFKQMNIVEHASLYITRSVERATEIAVQLKARDFLAELISKSVEFLSGMPEPERFRWVLDVGTSLLLVEEKSRRLVPRETWTAIHDIAMGGVCYHDAQENRNLSILHALMRLMSQISNVLKNPEKDWHYRVKIAESFEKESRFRENKEGGSGGGFAAFSFMEDALRTYQQLISLASDEGEKKRLRVKLDETKREIRRLIRRAESEMEPTFIKSAVPPELHEAFENIVESLLKVEPSETLKLLVCLPYLLPNIDALRQQARETAEQYPLQHLFKKVRLRDGRKVGETAPLEEEVTPLFDLSIWVSAQCQFLDAILYRLRQEGRFTKELYLAHLKEWEFLDEADVPFIEVALDRYFADDFVSALHILTPRIEHILKSAFEQAGLPSVVVPNTKQIREQTLGDFLDREEVRTALGDNLWYYLHYLLVDERGLNLRNDVAHGWIKFSECNRIPVQIVLFMILLLTCIGSEKRPFGEISQEETGEENIT